MRAIKGDIYGEILEWVKKRIRRRVFV